jgi:peptide deformylase
MVNPKLIYSSKETSAEWEGCASVGAGQKSLFGPVRRSKNCQISYTNTDEEEVIYNSADYLSHIILHEIDHLNGIIFLDRVEDPKMIMTAAELDEYAQKHGGKYPKIK